MFVYTPIPTYREWMSVTELRCYSCKRTNEQTCSFHSWIPYVHVYDKCKMHWSSCCRNVAHSGI